MFHAASMPMSDFGHIEKLLSLMLTSMDNCPE